MLDVPLGTVPEFDPDFEPFEAETVTVSPGPVTERPGTAYAPLEREVVLFWSIDDLTVTEAPSTAPCSSVT